MSGTRLRNAGFYATDSIKTLITSLEFHIDSDISYESQYDLMLTSLVKISSFVPTSKTICRAISTDCSYDTIVNVIKKAINLNEKVAFNNISQEDVYYDECTALHIAASSNNPEIVEALCKYGADLNARTEKQETPLHVAVQNNNPEIIKVLLKNGANVNLKDYLQSSSKTPLGRALENDKKDIANLLLEHGAR